MYARAAFRYWRRDKESHEAIFVACVLLIFGLSSFGFHYYDDVFHWLIFAATYAFLTRAAPAADHTATAAHVEEPEPVGAVS